MPNILIVISEVTYMEGLMVLQKSKSIVITDFTEAEAHIEISE